MGGKILQNRSSRLKSANKKNNYFHIEERSHFLKSREKNREGGGKVK
jgi:hypothetical protein